MHSPHGIKRASVQAEAVEGGTRLPSAPTGEFSAEHNLVFEFINWMLEHEAEIEVMLNAMPEDSSDDATMHATVELYLQDRNK